MKRKPTVLLDDIKKNFRLKDRPLLMLMSTLQGRGLLPVSCGGDETSGTIETLVLVGQMLVDTDQVDAFQQPVYRVLDVQIHYFDWPAAPALSRR